MAQQTTTPGGVSDVALAIGGTTCASCAARIEKRRLRLYRLQAVSTTSAESTHADGPSRTTLPRGEVAAR
jgi:hypothetical protein